MPRMNDRYSSSRYAPDVDYSRFMSAREPKPKKKDDPLADILGLVQGAAPYVGAGIGGLAAGLSSGGMGAPAGMAIGGALGSAAGGLAGMGREALTADDREAEEERLSKEDERRARQMAAMQFMGGF